MHADYRILERSHVQIIFVLKVPPPLPPNLGLLKDRVRSGLYLAQIDLIQT